MSAHSSPDMDELSAHSAEDQDPRSEPESVPVPASNPNDDDGRRGGGGESGDPEPPSYPASITIPEYTPRPAQGTEQTVVRGPPTAAELTGTVEYSAKRFQVTFGGQPIDRTAAQGPEYSKGSKIRGVVTVQENWRDRIGSVELKILGTIKLSIHDSGSTNTMFLEHTMRLHPDSESFPGSTYAPPCPETLPFKWPLPPTYVDTWGGPPIQRVRPLPPSYELTVVDVPGLRARVRYEVIVVVRWRWKGIVGRKESLSTPFNYVPYAPHPHHTHTSVLATLKTCPGEWASYTERVPTRSPDVGDIMSSLVLPTPPLHPLSQAIPFHFQLSAECPPNTTASGGRRHRVSISSSTPHNKLATRTPAPPTANKTQAGANSPAATATATSIPIALLAEPAVLRLTIQRQISVDVRGARALRVICGGVGRMERVVLGTGRRSGEGPNGRFEPRSVEVLYEGQVMDASGGAGTSTPGPSSPPADASLRRTNSLRSILSHMSGGGGGDRASVVGPIPPGVERVRDWEGGKDWFAIAWEGSVTPEKDVLRVGGFRAGGLLIKDFVTLTLVPPTPELSPLRALQQAVPIRCILVSEAEMQASMSGGW